MVVLVYQPDNPKSNELGMVDKRLVRRPELRPTFQYIADTKPYISPLSGVEVSSRRERREEMKIHNVREVDPSEGPHRDGSRYNNPDFINKHKPPGY